MKKLDATISEYSSDTINKIKLNNQELLMPYGQV